MLMCLHLLFFHFVVKMLYARCEFKHDFFLLICGLIKVTGILVIRKYLPSCLCFIFLLCISCYLLF